MSHEITRILSLISKTVWFIEPMRGDEMLTALLYRAEHGIRGERYLDGDDPAPELVASIPMSAGPNGMGNIGSPQKSIRVIGMHGAILPFGSAVSDMSGSGGVSIQRFMRDFSAAANDETVGAIVLDINSPGGQVDLVPEAAARIRAARRPGRPIVAVANTMAASAAYWIAAAADEIVVSPSGQVGSIGVFQQHQDHSKELEMEGVNVTFISAGPRKVEGNSFAPLDDVARAAMQEQVSTVYQMFTKDVAKDRGVSIKVVQADPVVSEKNFGGGRSVLAVEAVRLGLADRVATMDETIQKLMGRGSKASTRKRRLATM